MVKIRCFDMLEPQGRCKRGTDFTISSQPIGLAADHVHQHLKVKEGYQRDVYAKNDIEHVKYQFMCISIWHRMASLIWILLHS